MPPTPRITTIASQKGGVGKTTITLNLAYSVSRFGRDVLVIDGDPQGGMSAATNVRSRNILGIIDCLRGRCRPDDAITHTRDRTMAFLGMGHMEPDDIFFVEAEAMSGNLGKFIKSVAHNFSQVFIDAPPGTGSIVREYLAISQGVLIILTPSSLSLKGLPCMLKLIKWLHHHRNPGLQLRGVILNMVHDDESGTETLADIRQIIPDDVLYKTMIPWDGRFEQASRQSIPMAMITQADSFSRLFMDLTIEFKERELRDLIGAEDHETPGLF